MPEFRTDLRECRAVQVTVVMTTCNGRRFVAEALQSVFGQTHSDWRLVVVDDGSTDGTPEVVSSRVAGDSRVHVEVLPFNQGTGASSQKALEMATTDWCLRMSQDDVLLPECLEMQLKVLEANPGARVVSGRGIYINEAGRALGRTAVTRLSNQELERRVSESKPIGLLDPGTLLHRPTVLGAGGYRREFSGVEDCDLWGRLAERRVPIVTHAGVVVRYRLHAQSISSGGGQRSAFLGEWVAACMRARRVAVVEPSRAEFQRLWDARPAWKKVLMWREYTSRALYRQAGQMALDGAWARSAIALGAAALLAPGYVARRLVAQLVR
ncbi:MAG: glycosyltransferase [Candidatus Wallbacteria bacterium]|nr:glycosyltransferase [Candidatus Wallbacteria bacterium]